MEPVTWICNLVFTGPGTRYPATHAFILNSLTFYPVPVHWICILYSPETGDWYPATQSNIPEHPNFYLCNTPCQLVNLLTSQLTFRILGVE